MNDFDNLLMLIRLIDDPAATKARLLELQAAIDGVAAREAEANAAHAKLEAERTRLAKLAADLRACEVKVHLAENKIAGDLAQLQKWKRENAGNRLVTVGPSGLTREPDSSPVVPDPISDRYAQSMDKPGAVQVRRTSQRVRG